MTAPKRTALITHAGEYVGPALSSLLAARDHNLVLVSPAPGQAESLRDSGAEVLCIDGDPNTDQSPEGWAAVIDQALDHFGSIECAALFPQPLADIGFTTGPLMQADIGEVRAMTSYFDTTFFALQAVIPTMKKQGGQIVFFTSDAGVRPTADWALYGAVRAGQSLLIRATALEHAREGININVIGSKNAVFPGFPGAPEGEISDDRVNPGKWSAPLESETPLGRVGTMSELASFAACLLDGSNRFQTAQYFSFSGGWHAL